MKPYKTIHGNPLISKIVIGKKLPSPKIPLKLFTKVSELPPSIMNSKTLEHLNCANCYISDLPKYLTKISFIDITNTNITKNISSSESINLET